MRGRWKELYQNTAAYWMDRGGSSWRMDSFQGPAYLFQLKIMLSQQIFGAVLTRPNYTRMCHFPAIHCQVQRGWTRTMDVGNKSDCSGSFCLLVDLIMVTEWLLCWTIEKWLLILCIDFPPSNLPPTVNTVWKRQKDNFICQRRALLRPFQ